MSSSISVSPPPQSVFLKFYISFSFSIAFTIPFYIFNKQNDFLNLAYSRGMILNLKIYIHSLIIFGGFSNLLTDITIPPIIHYFSYLNEEFIYI